MVSSDSRGPADRAQALLPRTQGESRRDLVRLHSRDQDTNSPLIQIEIQEIEANISLSGADKRFWDFRALFHSAAAARYRFGL
jgi:hypothetical protein